MVSDELRAFQISLFIISDKVDFGKSVFSSNSLNVISGLFSFSSITSAINFDDVFFQIIFLN
jgi:hypothetical protein